LHITYAHPKLRRTFQIPSLQTVILAVHLVLANLPERHTDFSVLKRQEYESWHKEPHSTPV
jgi:hypothetical protein